MPSLAAIHSALPPRLTPTGFLKTDFPGFHCLISHLLCHLRSSQHWLPLDPSKSVLCLTGYCWSHSFGSFCVGHRVLLSLRSVCLANSWASALLCFHLTCRSQLWLSQKAGVFPVPPEGTPTPAQKPALGFTPRA